MHKLKFKLTLKGLYCGEYPHIQVGLNRDILYEGLLIEKLDIKRNDLLINDTHNLWIVLKNKTNANTTNLCDQAVIIENIEFEDISLPRFIWAGEYEPIYPEPWASQQIKSGKTLDSIIKNIDYLGFNGKWNLQFSTPIFTWIHKLENLGWIFN